MFQLFSKCKVDYHNDKGQIFPFVIAVICVLIIFIMITVNLGQIGIFKTDVSNAADAAALAGASVLSSTLLNVGLRSDQQCGRAVEVIIAIIIACVCCYIAGWIVAAIIYIVFLVEAWVNFMMVWGETKMGWTNAKRTAVQYAFNNAGVDEPRPTFEQFLRNAYGIINPSGPTIPQMQAFYTEYIQGSTPVARQYARSGFSRFIADGINGYWIEGRWGATNPSVMSEVDIPSGYGWNDDGGLNSYGSNNYKAGSVIPGRTYFYDNWVEVRVMGNSLFGLDSYSMLGALIDCLRNFLRQTMPIPWFLEWMTNVRDWVIDTFVWFLNSDPVVMGQNYPMGYQFMGPPGETDAQRTFNQVENNPIIVTVTRYKRNNPLGLWTFRYGETRANAVGHAFITDQNGNIPREYSSIMPQAGFMCDLAPLTGFGCSYYWPSWFDTKRHLFETKLLYAY